MERVGDRSTRKGCVAGNGKREVREETRACVGVTARRSVVVEASLEEDAAV